MNTPHVRKYALQSCALAVSLLLSPAGCQRHHGAAPQEPGADNHSTVDAHTASPSDRYMLLLEDLDKFQPGRSMEDILGDVQGRGSLAMAADHDGSNVYIIVYALYSDVPRTSLGDSVLAVFIDDKFVKFVEWLPGEMINVEIDGTPARRPKPIEVGNVDWLARAVEADAIDIEDITIRAKASPDVVPEPVDPGLTIVWLALRKSLEAAGQLPTEKDFKRNAQLHDQYNALRLRIGMSEGEVETALNGKPIESGNVAAGSFKIYGSEEPLNLASHVHFSNILVLYREGRAAVIFGVAAGERWRDQLREEFLDIP